MEISLRSVPTGLILDLGKLIGPRQYWLHNQFGGRHWNVKYNQRLTGSKLAATVLTVDDQFSPEVTMIILKHGTCIL
jgi:hypothetical protein